MSDREAHLQLQSVFNELNELRELLAECQHGNDKLRKEAAAHRKHANNLTRRVQELERLLDSLTPGGSEFSCDPEACARWVRERLGSVGKLALERNRYREALRHYADPDNWDNDGVCISELFPSGVEYMGAKEYIAEPDFGNIARAALEDQEVKTDD